RRARAGIPGFSARLREFGASARPSLFTFARFFTSLSLCLSALFFSLPAPIAPRTLFGGQPRIPCLRHGRPEHIQHADVLVLLCHSPQLLVHPLRILPCE